jgi:CubicO group peptidase (beta-lactamase class C family)
MYRSLLTILLLTIALLPTYGQKNIKGKIVNKTTQEPIAYANIGIVNSNVGTISNADGSFSLIIPSRAFNDTVVFSSLGFAEKVIAVKFLEQGKELAISLNPKITLLQAVIIPTKRESDKTLELGSRVYKTGEYEPDTTYAGRSMAILIDGKSFPKGATFPVYLEQASLRIYRNNLAFFKFRVRLNRVDKLSGIPGGDLLDTSIVVSSSMKNGWLKFDLSNLNFKATEPFFITFEQLLDQTDRTTIANGFSEFMRKYPERLKTDTILFEGKKEITQRITSGGINLPGTFIGASSSKSAIEKYPCFVREVSLGEWKKIPKVFAATVTVSGQFSNATTISNDDPCKGDDAVCRAEKLCNDFMEESGVNGMQIAISKKNKIVWSADLGYADLENKIRVTDSTQFRINSISKSVTSLALIKLMAENKLDLDVPIQKYVPAFPAKPYPVTTRQLAGHLAGFRDYKENDPTDYIRTEHFTNSTEALRIFENDTLLFEPGTRFYYSTFGWNLIGAIIEGASGDSYLDYMNKNIWTPLQLSNTCGDDIYQKHQNRSKFYDAAGQVNDLGDMSYKYSGGGLLSTATDMVKLGNEILHGHFIDTKLKAVLFESQVTADKKKTGYGIGWYVGSDKNGHRIWYHAGDSFSGSSYLIIYPDDDMVISFLANSQEGTTFDVQKLAALFYKK